MSRFGVQFYERFIHPFAQCEGPAALVLYGGRGLGKSSVLEVTSERLKERNVSAERILCIDGMLAGRAIELLGDIETRNVQAEPVFILLDNLDQLILQTVWNGADPAKNLITKLWPLFSVGAEYNFRTMATSGVNPNRIKVPPEFHHEYTYTLTHASSYRLNPWPPRWRERLKVQLIDLVKAVFANLKSDQSEKLAEDIIEISGGHPSLVNASVEFLKILQEDVALIITDRDVVDIVLQRVRNHLRESGLIRKPLLEVKKEPHGDFLMSELARLADPDDAEVWPAARHETSKARPLSPEEVRQFLEHQGLVYMDGLKYKIPGQILKEEILSGIGARLDAHYSLESDLEDSGNRGKLIRKDQSGVEVSVPFARTQWKILKCLFDKAGEPMSVKALEEETRLNERTIRSGYQRLVSKLSLHGLEVTENVPGEGYRFKG